MARVLHSDARKFGLAKHMGALCIVAFSLLLARTVTAQIDLPSASIHPVARMSTSQAKHQFLDHDDGFQSCLPTLALKTSPASNAVSLWVGADDPILPLRLKGFHYNRPPPLT